jgi:uncharacterized protein (TIGR03067 family)
MIRTAVLTLLASLLPAADPPPAPGAAPAADALQGTWSLSSFVVNGDKATDDQLRLGRLSIVGDQYAPTFGTVAVGARFTIDPTKTPRTIDFTYLDGPQRGKTVKGIYSIEGDTLTVCRGLSEGEPRPTRFEAPADSEHMLIVWTRATAGAGEAARELERLQGSWSMLSATTDGKDVPEETARRVTVGILGSSHSVRVGGKVVSRDVGFEVDPTANPKAVTDTVPAGQGRRAVVRGIYKLDGDALTTCMAAAGHDRPTSFDAGPGTGRTLRVFRRDPDARDPSAADGLEHLKFEGTWAFESFRVAGKLLPIEPFREARLTLKGDRFISVDSRGTIHGTFKADAESSPKMIDVTYTDGPDAGQTLLGVYTLDGDTYRVSFAPLGMPRPAKLDEAGGTVSVLRKLKH